MFEPLVCVTVDGAMQPLRTEMGTRRAAAHEHGFHHGPTRTVEYMPCEKKIVKWMQGDAVPQKNDTWVSFGQGRKLVAVFADGSTTKTDLEHDDVFNDETIEPPKSTEN